MSWPQPLRALLIPSLLATACGIGSDAADLSALATDASAADGSEMLAIDGGLMADLHVSGPTFVYVSGGSTQLSRYTFDLSTGQLTPMGVTTVAANSSFLAIDPLHRHLYAVNDPNQVSAYSINGTTGALSALNAVSSGGSGPAHLSLDRTFAWLLVSNYGSGDIEVLPVLADGSLGAASDGRNAGIKAHQILTDSTNQFAFVPCLGSDYIAQYAFDPALGKLNPNTPPSVATAAAAGPRHLALHPNGAYAYSIQETDSTMTAYRLDSSTGQLTALQTLSTLPAGFSGTNTGAEVWVHPSGKFLYGSNRGDDSIVEYGLDVAGKMTLVGHTKTGGMRPRDFAIDPSGRWLLVVNQSSNNLVELSIDTASGSLTQVGTPTTVPAGPTFVGFATF
jgi:6-phosphogluconolactonase